MKPGKESVRSFYSQIESLSMQFLRSHGFAVLIAVLFAGIYTVEGILFKDYNLDEFQVATGYLKDTDPTLFPKDFIWSKPAMVRNLHVSVRKLMEVTDKICFKSVNEPIDLFLIWLPIAFILFFLGNYLLSYHFSRSHISSLLVACCFMLVRRTVYDWWGIGPTFTMSARGIVLALLPLGFWFFLQSYSDYKKLAVFSFCWGLISNFHPLSGWGLMEFLGLTLLFVEKSRPKFILKILTMAFFVLLGSLPFLIIWNKVAIVPSEFRPDPLLIKKFLDYYQFLQADIRKYLIGFLEDLSIPLVISCTGFYYSRKQKLIADPFQWGVAKVFSFAVVIAVLGIVALGLLWDNLRYVAPIMATEHARNIKMVYLTLPIWMGLGFQGWLQQNRSNSSKWGVSILIVLISLSINFPGHKLARFVAYKSGSLSQKSSLKFENELEQDSADLSLSLWARSSTSKDSLFYFDSYEFRYYAQRSLVFCSFDRPCIAFHPSVEMEEWDKRCEIVTSLKKNTNIQGMLDAAKQFGADYLVVLNSWGASGSSPIWKNEKYSVFAISNSL
jgi:hypothetical protein